jgi:hypothetical protein
MKIGKDGNWATIIVSKKFDVILDGHAIDIRRLKIAASLLLVVEFGINT